MWPPWPARTLRLLLGLASSLLELVLLELDSRPPGRERSSAALFLTSESAAFVALPYPAPVPSLLWLKDEPDLPSPFSIGKARSRPSWPPLRPYPPPSLLRLPPDVDPPFPRSFPSVPPPPPLAVRVLRFDDDC